MLTFEVLGVDDYDRAKKVLNRARHPGFVGRELFHRCTTRGVCCLAVLDGDDVAIAMVASDKLQALSVVATAQGGGVGAQLLARVKPRWASVIGSRVEWFQRRGYVAVGAPKVGQSGKHSTQLMELSDAPTPVSAAPTPVSAAPKQQSIAGTVEAQREPVPVEAQREPVQLTADEQREHIVQLMMERAWHPGRCHKELAEQWGIGARTVAQRALEASRAIALAGMIKDQVDAAIQELDSLQAMAICDPDGPNVRAAVECIKLKMTLLGAMHTAKKVQEDAPETYMKLTPAERIEAHRVAIVDEETKMRERH